jgi:hypothetical protein
VPPSSDSAASKAEAAQRQEAADWYKALGRRILMGLTTALLCYRFVQQSKPLGFSDVFLYHPTAMAVAWIGIAPEIVAMGRGARKVRNFAARQQALAVHGYVAYALKVLSLVGFIAIWMSKRQRNKPHFATWHGKLGLLTMIGLAVQVLSGTLLYLGAGRSPRPKPWLTPVRAGNLRRLHRLAAIAAVAASALCLVLGLGYSHYAIKHLPAPYGPAAACVATVLCFVLAYRVA